MRRFCFIVNPAANRSRSASPAKILKKRLGKWTDSVSIKYSTNSGELKNMAAEAAKNFDVVVACGGDGTVSQVASGLVNTGATMGIIPLGSGNDFIKAIGIPNSIDAALKILKAGDSKMIDMGKCNEIYFINTLGFGFDALTNQYASNSNIFNGTMRYVFAALKASRVIKPFHAEVISNDMAGCKTLLMVTFANGNVEGGSFKVAPDASVTDGKLDALIVNPVGRWLLPILLPGFVMGMQKKMPFVTFHQNDEFIVRLSRPVPIHADGETIDTDETHFKIKVIPSVLNVIGNY